MKALETITDPNTKPQKADILVNLYQSQNTKAVDDFQDLKRRPISERQLQIEAIEEMRKLDFDVSKRVVIPVLDEYLKFMNLKGKTHSRGMLQLNIAHLITDNIQDKDIQDLGRKYLESASIQEWTKGRIATSILNYEVSKITDSDDPDLSIRTNMILNTACLSTLEQQLHAPKRMGRSQLILNELYDGRHDMLVGYIKKNRMQISETQEYFLSYASVMNALKKKNNQQELTEAEVELVEMAKECRGRLLQKTSVFDESCDQILDRALKY